ncbi:hypothetical protein [Exilibacterium tricleocarpae]|uniref:hypothetical protein n=1 Tax=Exilibacterium tricleocarpae TaxID=2591008 RepID=UPI0015D1F480|nr:hypothetical protein [Exilibacterium tricleocarpae]
MVTPDDEFSRIAQWYVAHNPDVQLGKMMSSPGLKCNGKVFAFQNRDTMGFRLGPDFNPKAIGLKTSAPLSPFRTKPPLRGWFVVTAREQDRWQGLADAALNFTRTLLP